jgi:GNAT superfamily N-acetyltransferase
VNQINIREATTADLPALLAFEQGVVEAERPYNSKIRAESVHYYDIAELIAQSESVVLVAEKAGRLIATGHISLKRSSDYYEHDRHGYLGLMYVEPAFRGQGLIQAIIDELLAWARGQGIKDFFLDVYADNEPAIRAYEKFGFRANMLEMKLRD